MNSSWTQRLDGRVIAAVPVPFDEQGTLDREAQRRYIQHMNAQPVGGVAVWAHTGRGLRLDDAQRAAVLADWRAGLGPEKLVIAAAGADACTPEVNTALARARGMAEAAAALGADALLVYPPAFTRGRGDLDELVLAYHDAIASVGIPLILFYLYEAAGGVSYSTEVLEALFSRPEVVGIKIATLDSVMTFQDIAALLRVRFPEKVLLTGEDRFLGYSLMCGARSALIGMAAAQTTLQTALLDAYVKGDAAHFLHLNAAVDTLAQATFRAPMEGYVQRMLWCLVHEGVIPAESSFDPWGPPLPAGEFARLGHVLHDLARR